MLQLGQPLKGEEDGNKEKEPSVSSGGAYGESDKRCLTNIMALGHYKFTGKAIRDAVKCYSAYLEVRTKVEDEFKGDK